VIASIVFGGPAVAAVKMGTTRLAQLAGSAEFESSILAALGAGFLAIASAVRRLQSSSKESLS
jgi:hypothetical protein